MNTRYNAADIEVLSGLDPVKRRPGMYTDTTRPNHLAQEVIDNSVWICLAIAVAASKAPWGVEALTAPATPGRCGSAWRWTDS